MFYIHQNACISPQQSYADVDLSVMHESSENRYRVIEPIYQGLPPGVLRRMGKAVRIGVGAGSSLSQNADVVNGVIIGTANGGMEDCIRFLDQIIQYEEGKLTPGNFVQSTPNAIAAMLSMLTGNKGYNITHVHRGLAFENAILDAVMRLREFPGHSYLLGAVDEISAYNYNIEMLGGWYKEENVTGDNFYQHNSPGSVAGEGAAAFVVNTMCDGAAAQLRAVTTLHTDDAGEVKKRMASFVDENRIFGEEIDVFLSGENGDNRMEKFYQGFESLVPGNAHFVRFKHMSGEYPTASSFALWFGINILQSGNIPLHSIKKSGTKSLYRNVLIYNTYKGTQHSLMLCSVVNK